MNADWLDFDLPPELIAQHPCPERDGSRLLVIDRAAATFEHRTFRDLPLLLRANDLMVANDTRVIPARVIGCREKTGGRWEGLFLRETPEGLWEMLAQTRGKPETGESIVIEPGRFSLILRGRAGERWLAEPSPPAPAVELLNTFGHIPLPPYIRKGVDEPDDRERYQTIFAARQGSVAAPTAGLHFTPELLEELRKKGIEQAKVTLHVGLGTFAPIKTEDPTKHEMHSEWGSVPESTVDAINHCRSRGGRVIAIGTTATRALESAASSGKLQPWTGETRIFIHPPHQFRAIDGLITNFHLPRTTLLLLVAALCGEDTLKRAYAEAIRQRYRFFSYGDAMLIL
ncbi:tRNA preQ1(34) S-adenosylmethionine ribosyltransferase-isomerase QueA [Zavarzinella formosa]|uniref:tRNA preQ1(34) S-adenosylmethionine ribosyltransferase-isomerase QueA n=1 Tax=Zavarzinella formosa TaxID=360055 RepID=UPI0002F41BF8|nr:tRNA preQ1(34) S-adenosylmethionine ribosyltransferase-isomerase QueA [Zavarzinella formosa]